MIPDAIVTDIEGTTSSISFVHDVLFPYSRAKLPDFVLGDPGKVSHMLAAVRAEAGDVDLTNEACVALLLKWHDADRKIALLKELQGVIWAEGYAQGAFRGHVYPDAVAGLRRWSDRKIPLYVFSSGSIAAQKLLFRHTDYGDLTSLFTGYFDTMIGAKRNPDSYKNIAHEINVDANKTLFLSDTPEELGAAREAGLAVKLLARAGPASDNRYSLAASFDSILP